MTLRLDHDFWSARMAYLAELAHADAIAVVLQTKAEGYVTYVAHNVPIDTTWREGVAAALLAKAVGDRTTDQAATAVAVPLADGRVAKGLAVAPVVWKDQLVGGLAAMRVGNVFAPDEISRLTRVGELIGLELAEANALWRSQRQQQEAETRLKVVRDVQAIIRKEADTDKLLDRVTAQLVDAFSADGVSIMLANGQGELSVRSSRGLGEAAKAERKQRGQGVSGKVAATGKAVLLSGAVPGGSDSTAIESMVAPLQAGGITFGVVNVKHRGSPDRYSPAHLETLSQVAADIAAALLMTDEFNRAKEDRRHALALYELSRFATLGTEAASDLESAVAGVLVLGRATVPYEAGDADFAATIGEYFGGMLAKSATTTLVDRTAATERRRIAQELHDGLAQELTGVVLALEGCQRALERDPSLLGPQLAKAARDARATLSDVRQYMAALRQTEEAGGLNLPVTIARLVDDLRRQSGLHVDFEDTGEGHELEPFVERAVIRIVGEALRNVGSHSGARNAKVHLRYDDEQIVVTVDDDGKGFESAELDTAEGRGHYGIVGMRERAEGVGGELVVRSEPGRGTVVRASIPYRAHAEEVSPPTFGQSSDDASGGAVEDIERTEKASFIGRLFGR